MVTQIFWSCFRFKPTWRNLHLNQLTEAEDSGKGQCRPSKAAVNTVSVMCECVCASFSLLNHSLSSHINTCGRPPAHRMCSSVSMVTATPQPRLLSPIKPHHSFGRAAGADGRSEELMSQLVLVCPQLQQTPLRPTFTRGNATKCFSCRRLLCTVCVQVSVSSQSGATTLYLHKTQTH